MSIPIKRITGHIPENDYQVAGDTRVIKKSIIPIIRIVVKNSKRRLQVMRK